MKRLLLLITACGLPSLINCGTHRDPEHCVWAAGDATCVDRGFEYCSGCTNDNKGCRNTKPSDACWVPCGDYVSFEENPDYCGVDSEGGSSTGDGSSDTSAGSSNTTDDPSADSSGTGPTSCVFDDDCLSSAAPFCDVESGNCVSCDGVADGDGACEGLDPALPICVDGACVECTEAMSDACSGTTPLCDDETHSCVPCMVHSDCGPAACNLFTGACLPAANVVHVGAGQPFTSLGEALTSMAAESEATIILHAGADFNESVSVDGGRVRAFLAASIGAEVEPPRWVRTSGNSPQLTVLDGTVLVDGLQVSGNPSVSVPGVSVINGGALWLDRTRVIQNGGGGVEATNATFVVRNSFLGGNVADVDAVTATQSSVEMTFTTVGAGLSGFTPARALVCDATSEVVVRNSVLVSAAADPEVACAAAEISNTIGEGNFAGTGNQAVGPLQATWFTSYNTGDFHLNAPPAVFGTTAEWLTGDPSTDIDDEPRITLDGNPGYAGADLP